MGVEKPVEIKKLGFLPEQTFKKVRSPATGLHALFVQA